jgi:hypothetical protein
MTADTTDDGAVVVVRPALEAAVAGTVSHPPDGLVDVPHTATGHRTSFEVTAEGSLQAASCRVHHHLPASGAFSTVFERVVFAVAPTLKLVTSRVPPPRLGHSPPAPPLSSGK